MWRNKIEQFIESHKEEMIRDIFRLCRIDSEKMPEEEGKPFGPGIDEALKAADDMAKTYGFSTTNYDNYVMAVDLNDKEPRLDILVHVDVVPAGEGWTVTEAFEPIMKDGRIYARGAADNKGPAVAALYALWAVKELQIPLSGNCRLVFGTDEESGFGDIEYYYSKEQEAPMTFAPDLCFPVVNVEKGPAGIDFEAQYEKSQALPRLCSLDCGIKGNVVPGKTYAVVEGIGYEVLAEISAEITGKTGVEFLLEPIREDLDGEDWNGAEPIRITAIGTGCHASHAEDGNNALTAMVAYLDRLSLAPCRQVELLHELAQLMPHGDVTGEHMGVAMADEISGHLSLNFTMLFADETTLTGHFDSRRPICANEDNFTRIVKEKLEAAGLTWTGMTEKPPHYVPEESPFVQTLLRVFEDCTDRRGECLARGGYTYVHGMKNGVAFGASMPENDNRMHGPDEFAVVEELVVSAKIFAQVIAELCL